MKNKSINGKQYGRPSEANRAIRNHCKKTRASEKMYIVNQLDWGSYEVTHRNVKWHY
jgi:hypothetical protein